MAEATGIVLVKEFNYRGNPNEEWSNKYWLSGTPPDTATDWKNLADGLFVHEQTCWSAGTKGVRAYGYDDNSPDANSVWSYDYKIAGEQQTGSLPATGGVLMAGDQAGTVYWKTSRKTSRGKWIYLRKYFHDGFVDTVDTDSLSLATANAYAAFAQILAGGTFQGRKIRSQNQDELLAGWGRSGWVTTRTLKRRGRRPTVAP